MKIIEGKRYTRPLLLLLIFVLLNGLILGCEGDKTNSPSDNNSGNQDEASLTISNLTI